MIILKSLGTNLKRTKNVIYERCRNVAKNLAMQRSHNVQRRHSINVHSERSLNVIRTFYESAHVGVALKPNKRPRADWRSIVCLRMIILKSLGANLKRTKNVIL